MLNLLPTDIILVLILLATIVGQWYWGTHPNRPVKDAPKVQPTVTRASPEFVNESAIGQGESSIIEPKTPQRIAFEEQEELRKMNLGPR